MGKICVSHRRLTLFKVSGVLRSFNMSISQSSLRYAVFILLALFSINAFQRDVAAQSPDDEQTREMPADMSGIVLD